MIGAVLCMALVMGIDLGAIGVGVALGGGVSAGLALVTAKYYVRRQKAEADQAEVTVDLTELEITGLRQRLTSEVLADARAELGQYRERVAEERTRAAEAVQGQAEAQARLAAVQVQLAEALETASKERHELRGEIAVLATKNLNLTHEVEELREEIKSLRAQLDAERYGRRDTDGPEH